MRGRRGRGAATRMAKPAAADRSDAAATVGNSRRRAGTAPQADAGTTEDKMAQLQQLKQLLDSGVLTQAEFDAQKQKILQSM